MVEFTKTACVIGSKGTIGRAIVERLRKDGWTAVIEMDKSGGQPIDVTDPTSVAAAFSRARKTTPRLGLMVVASGILDLDKLNTITPARWNEVLSVNLTGPFLCCLEARDWLEDGGRIVLLSSLAGRTGGVLTGTAYAASKGGVESLAKSVAQELSGRRITVNCVAPGGVENSAMIAASPPSARAAAIAATPLKRMVEPEEIAGAVAFLASPDAAFITGCVLPVNGGVRMD